MPGLFGGDVAIFDDESTGSAVYRRPVHQTTRFETDPCLGVVHHGDRDPGGHAAVIDDDVAGVVYGAVTNRDVTSPLVGDVLERPAATLRSLDGPFAIACLDRNSGRIVLATDRLASRAVYYTTDDAFAFASELTPLVAAVDDPTVDPQAVSDLLYMNHIWGEKTLLADVRSIRPGSYLVVEDGDHRLDRYWSYTFADPSGPDYVNDLANAYESAVDGVADTTAGQLGVWLSGGLDSRMLASLLSRGGRRPRAYTYNRPLDHDLGIFRDNIDIAAAVAEALDIRHDVIDITPERLVDRIPELVRITDGQVGWQTGVHLSAAFDIDAEVGVLFEGPTPLLCGEHVWASWLGGDSHPADALYDMHERVDGGLVSRALAAPVEPKDTFIDESRSVPKTGRDERILEATHQNYNAAKHFRTNKIARAVAGTRCTLANESLLDRIGEVPVSYRTRTIPFTGGRIPHVPSRLKLELMRQIDPTLSRIPYDGSQLPPTVAHWLHGVGFVVRNAVERSLSISTLGRWYRDDETMRSFVDGLVLSAAERDLFDADAVLGAREAHLAGDADHMSFVASLTTVELFLQEVLDR